VSVEAEPSARTVSAGLASWATASEAIGGLSGGGALENSTWSSGAFDTLPS